MTGTDRTPPAEPGGQTPPADDPAGAPLTLELLADLHAGLFDQEISAALHRRVSADSRAGTMLAALDATVADLGALPHQRTPRMPEDVANRLDAALDAEAQTSLPVPMAELAVRRRRRTGWASFGILTAAAAAVGVAALSGVQWEITGTPRASDAFGSAIGVQPSEPPVLTRNNLAEALDRALKAPDYGPLSPPQVLRNCLRANGVQSAVAPLGALEVTSRGTHGVLLALPADRNTRIRLLVVGHDCGPGNPATLAEYVVQR
ncbi:MAG TPA: hypothetical protein VGJ13_04125 [Pseudonocardiaceae bacterium]